MLDPRAVFQSLYRPAVIEAIGECSGWLAESSPEERAGLVECQMVEQYDILVKTGRSSSLFRREYLETQSGRLCGIRSNQVCLICLVRAAQHRWECGHTLCDHCAQVFGFPASGFEYKFTLPSCLCCLYRRPLVIDVLPPTMNPTILAIDGGGVRGVIPLEFLILIQENLGSCALQDLFDLSIGTSSGLYYFITILSLIHFPCHHTR